MQDHAASAALYPPESSHSNSNAVLGDDGKLSSASAATSLKYAKARDLPSFPSTGGVQMSSAGAAASLASSNRKSFEHWKPEPIPAANKAALLAKDHKMDPLWKPEASAAGSKAAMLAHAHPTHVEPMQPKRNTTIKAAAPSAAYDTAENTHEKAMMAATAASHNRRRSGSLPVQPSAKSVADTSWAMKAANKSHKDGIPTVSAPFASGDPGFEAARIQNVAKNNVDRQLYTSNPPVAIEVQEKNRQDTLRASAVAMAQKMYAIQQKHIDEAAGKTDSQALAASRARSSTVTGSSGSTGGDITSASAGYGNLEEAARKLAQERLAKIHDEHAEYRNYYGQTSGPPRSRLSMRGSRRGPSNVADDDDSDEEQSRKIRSQMSIFQSKLADVDNKKRQQDRDALLQIAHRNVDAQISKMDDKVFQDTGKATPAQMEKWEKSAREKAQRDSDERMQYAGKVHIGGGKYLEQSELDAIAKARLQPTLDDISAKAEKHRAQDEEERLERVRKQEQMGRDKARTAETAAQVKAETERQKQETRNRKEEEKRLQREEHAAEKARREEEKRVQKETKPGRISTLFNRSGAATGAVSDAGVAEKTATTTSSSAEPVSMVDLPTTSETTSQEQTFHDQVTSPTAGSLSPVVTKAEPAVSSSANMQIVPTTTDSKSIEGRKSMENRSSMDEEDEAVASPSKSRVKSWMKVKFRSKSNVQKDNERVPPVAQPGINVGKEKNSSVDEPMPRTDSMRDVAMAGRTTTAETDDMYGTGKDVSPQRSPLDDPARGRSPSISSLSSDESQERKSPTNFPRRGNGQPEPDGESRGRSGLKQRLLNKIKPAKDTPREEPIARATSNTTDDEFEEARDHFDEEKLAPPPPLSTVTGEGSASQTLSPKGSRERSRFTEDL